MPHFTVEYSENLSERYDLQRFADVLRDEAQSTGVFPLGGIRVRAYSAQVYTIADGHPKNAFVSILIRIGANRDDSTKKSVGQSLFDTACEFFASELADGHFMISLDIVENDPGTSFKRSTVHKRLEQQAQRP